MTSTNRPGLVESSGATRRLRHSINAVVFHDAA